MLCRDEVNFSFPSFQNHYIVETMQDILTVKSNLVKATDSVRKSYNDLLKRSDVGFTDIPFRETLFSKSHDLAEDIASKYDRIVFIGIGGSSMGARALYEIAGSAAIPIFFLDNVDADQFTKLKNESIYSQEVASKTAFLVVSKSGATIEVLWNYSMLDNLLKKYNLDIKKQSFFVSDLESNPISNLARENKRPLLEIPADIGGRFSVLTPVGLIVAKICGYDLQKIKEGANLCLKKSDLILNCVQSYLDSFSRKEEITLFWFYHSRYRWFGAWLQQLWAESLGKKHDLQGLPAPAFSTPMFAIGACDQHSILQQVAHGVKNKFVCFYSFSSAIKSEFEMTNSSFTDTHFPLGLNYGELIRLQAEATAEALSQNNVSNMSFLVHDQDISIAVGYLFMHFQLVIATLGLHENINPFDQPGVALGKELTLQFLKKQR